MTIGGTGGVVPSNPITGGACAIGSGVVSNVQAARATSATTSFGPGAGNLSYDVLLSNTSYGICGGDSNGNTLGAYGKIQVLSNQ
jgi:hypothetical protein